MSDPVIHRLDLGHFVRPASETGTGLARVEAALAYLVHHDRGLLLFDSGLGEGSPEVDAHYRPVRRSLDAALAAVGATAEDIALVINSHLHFDHCGGNPALVGCPVLVQATELAAARAGDYTIDALVDFPGAVYERLDGEAEIWPGVWVVPTPGHTAGHQSLVVEGSGGTTLLAGQAYDFASEYACADLARRTGVAETDGLWRPWLTRMAELDVDRALFAHDHAAWQA
ncbi:MBL fold metallo-hydrolase [Streptomyces sp. E11-3]|uniref:MBL fold metallo-hydrolase n=1 Tax=Streptomyces sp. E11-3 TaxID=3110112 RepID=UPI00397EF917